MRKYKFIALIVLIAAATSSCLKENASDDAVSDADYSTVSVSITGLTKAAVAEEEIRSVDVFVVNDEGRLEAHVRKDRTSVVEGIYVQTGEKDFRIFVNFPEVRMNAITNAEELESFRPAFTDNAFGALTMRGEIHEKVDSKFFNTSVTVRRDAAKVIMTAAPVFKGHAEGGRLLGVYLNNIPKEYDESVVLTEDAAEKAWNHRNTEPEDAVKVLSSAEGENAWESVLYGYPNASPEAPDADTEDYVTKLILKVDVGGEQCYYLVGIPGMQANTVYTVNSMVLSVKGSGLPNIYNKQTFDIELEMQPWDDGEVATHYNPAGHVLYSSTPSVSKTWEGGTEDIVLTAYEEKSDSNIPYTGGYKAYFSKDDGATWTDGIPEGVNLKLKSNDEGKAVYSLSVARETPMNTITGNEWPEDEVHNTYKGSPGAPFDLSMNRTIRYGRAVTGRNTANCYVINAPGTYMLPLVYGNAITDNKNNEKAYKTDKTADFSLKTFLNAYDAEIRSPYIDADISHQNHYPSSASLVWSEEKDVISVESGLRARDGMTFLVFTIPADKVKPSNALVAAHDENGKIIWSWHIWITPEDLKLSDIWDENNYKYYYFLSHNLGQMPLTQSADYAKPLRYILRFVQDSGTKQYVDISVERHEYRENIQNYPAASVLYQWGRKDPFPSSDTVYPAGAWYPGKKNDHKGHQQGYEIQRPTEIFTWSETIENVPNGTRLPCIYNLWDTDCVAENEIVTANRKSIYDPSPVGFRVLTKRVLELTGDCIENNGSIAGRHYSYDNVKYGWVRDGIATSSDYTPVYLPSSRVLNYDGQRYGFSSLWSSTRGAQCAPFVFGTTYFHPDAMYGHTACVRCEVGI